MSQSPHPPPQESSLGGSGPVWSAPEASRKHLSLLCPGPGLSLSVSLSRSLHFYLFLFFFLLFFFPSSFSFLFLSSLFIFSLPRSPPGSPASPTDPGPAGPSGKPTAAGARTPRSVGARGGVGPDTWCPHHAGGGSGNPDKPRSPGPAPRLSPPTHLISSWHLPPLPLWKSH